MRRVRWVLGWLFDWRSGAVVVATVLVALLAVAVVVSAQSTRDALDANRTQHMANEQQVKALNDRITVLEGLVRDGNQRTSELLAEVTALQEQVRQLGGKPVVVNQSAASPSPTTTPPRPTPTTAPPTTTTSPQRCVGVVCIGR